MEPKQFNPNSGFEQGPPTPGSLSEAPLFRPEKEQSAERQHEQLQVPAPGEGIISPPSAVPALPTPVVQDDTDDSTTIPVDDTPLIANDDDLIEKEWVDKAKKIISETKDDPFRREKEVGKLQIEYVKKRYGRHIGDVPD